MVYSFICTLRLLLISRRDNTATLRDINLGRGRVSLNSGRNSDIRGELPGDDTDNTFAFMIPPRDVPSPALRNDTSPAAEFSLMQYNNDSEAVEEEVIGDPLDGLDPDTELPDTQGNMSTTLHAFSIVPGHGRSLLTWDV